MKLALRIASRELRGGLKGFRVFLICLALGVAAIAGVATLRASIQGGLEDQGAILLGGDAEMEFTYRYAEDDERAFMARIATRISEVLDFRSMVLTAEDQALTQVKAVDGAWPLLGQVELEPALPLALALAGEGGLPGAVMDPVLMARLDLSVGARFHMGRQEFVLMAALLREPDSAGAGFSLGPRTLVASQALAASGLVGPGALFETKYRLALPPGSDLAALAKEARDTFRDKGMRWRDSRNAAPGVERFVNNIASFLVLVGLAGLAVGGVGIQAATRSWLEGKIRTIATLKTLGAPSGMIFLSYLIQVGLIGAIGIILGLVIGAGVPMICAPLIEGALPFPVRVTLAPGALVEAAFYGVMTVLIFTLWPLARAEKIRVAALYREGAVGLPRRRWLVLLVGLVVALVGVATLASGIPALALGAAGGIAAALALLALVAYGLRHLAHWASRRGVMRGKPALRGALAAIGAPRSEALAVVLSLGLGLSVLAAIGQIDANLRLAIDRDLPQRAPAFFFVDIQPDQIAPFIAKAGENPAVTRVETAPMLRGVLAQINGRPAREVAGDHWVVRGDRGISYAADLPEGTRVTAGEWWPKDYSGSPQISFAQAEADEIGLKLGDELTVNVLGRDISARVTSFREVNFASGGMGFVIVMNETALKGAPHSHIATLYAPPEAEAPILRDVTRSWPNITAIAIRDAVARVTEALDAIAKATAWTAAGTLITGFVVLIGSAAAGEKARSYEAAILKVLGASRARVLASFALRSALLGAAAGLVAVLAGALAGWAVMTFVMEGGRYVFEPWSALAIILGGILATLLAGVIFAARSMRVRPARMLRAD